jgi:hypothetical protein
MTQALQLNTQRTTSVKMIYTNRTRTVNLTMPAIIQNTKFIGFFAIPLSPNSLMKKYCPRSFLICNILLFLFCFRGLSTTGHI